MPDVQNLFILIFIHNDDINCTMIWKVDSMEIFIYGLSVLGALKNSKINEVLK